MKNINLLYVEDDKENRDNLTAVLQDEQIGDFTISINAIDSFENAISEIKTHQYHIVILDIFLGDPKDNGKEEGLITLEKIQELIFIPIIFFSGNTKNVQDLKSQIVGVVTKGDGDLDGGIEGLKKEINRLAISKLPFIKDRIHSYIEEEFKTFFWDIIHNERNMFKPEMNDLSLGYLMLRKFGTSLSKEKISQIIQDNNLNKEKVHPMAFYLYPTNLEFEYQSGEIIQKDNDIFVILTPSCDFVQSANRSRKVGKVLLAKTTLLKDDQTYKKYISNKDKYRQSISDLIESRKGDRYFFLPQTPFIENRIIDFQLKEIVDYEKLNEFRRVAKLDSPFAQSMISSFIRYYNRIGYPDIDSQLIIDNLKE